MLPDFEGACACERKKSKAQNLMPKGMNGFRRSRKNMLHEHAGLPCRRQPLFFDLPFGESA